MKTTKVLVGAACALTFGFGFTKAAHAAPSCKEVVTRATVVACALEASLASQSERLGLAAVEGRRRSAAIVLPSNPVVSVTGGLPVDASTTERTPLWSAALSQEVEIAGQRGARLGVVGAERRAQEGRILATQHQAAADALAAYFDALASAEHLRLANRLTPLASALKEVGRGRAEVGLGSNVDAVLAESAAIRLGQAQIEAEQQTAITSATLSALLGFNPNEMRPPIEGELTPIEVSSAAREALVENAIARRADLVVLTAERESQERRIKLFERLRIPNPTVSVFARRDWIGERSVGLGLSFPIPLPSPLGRTHAGEIAEAESLTRRAEVKSEQLRRTIRLEVIRASEAVSARERQVALYTPDHLRKSEAALGALAEELVAKRLPIREALIAQQGLLETLFGHIEARRALCLASVELARVAGVEIERGVR
jgi:cobalt-zinc-cadmium efflux system outer membrane protein